MEFQPCMLAFDADIQRIPVARRVSVLRSLVLDQNAQRLPQYVQNQICSLLFCEAFLAPSVVVFELFISLWLNALRLHMIFHECNQSWFIALRPDFTSCFSHLFCQDLVDCSHARIIDVLPC